MSDVEQLVQRVIDTVTTIAGKASAFATRLLIAVAVVSVGGFLLGVAALAGSPGLRSLWIVLGIVFGAIAIGAAFVARWRVGSITRHVPEIATEVRSLISQGKDTTRTVIETFAVDEDGDGRRDGLEARSALVLTRRVYGFHNAIGSGLESSARLTAAVTALTSFPGLVLAAIGIGVVFAFLGVIFLIALAL